MIKLTLEIKTIDNNQADYEIKKILTKLILDRERGFIEERGRTSNTKYYWTIEKPV